MINYLIQFKQLFSDFFSVNFEWIILYFYCLNVYINILMTTFSFKYGVCLFFCLFLTNQCHTLKKTDFTILVCCNGLIKTVLLLHHLFLALFK